MILTIYSQRTNNKVSIYDEVNDSPVVWLHLKKDYLMKFNCILNLREVLYNLL